MEQQLHELFVQNNGYLASNLIRGNRSPKVALTVREKPHLKDTIEFMGNL